MENQVNSKNIIINYGLILGGISIIMNLIMYATNNHLAPHWSISLIGFIALIALIVLGVKKFKESNNNYLTFGQALKVGVGIAIVSALLVSIYNYVFMTVIEPTYMDQVMELQSQTLIEQGYTDDQIEATQEMGKKLSGPFITSAFTIIGAAFLGFVISAITGAIMKKTEDQY